MGQYIPVATDVKRDNHWSKDHNGIWRRTTLLEDARTNIIQYSAGPFNESPGGVDFWDSIWSIDSWENVASCVEGGHAIKATCTLDSSSRFNIASGTYSDNVEVISGIFERVGTEANRFAVYAWGNPSGSHQVGAYVSNWSTMQILKTEVGNGTVVDFGWDDLGVGPNGGQMIRLWCAFDSGVANFTGETRTAQWRLHNEFSGVETGIMHHAQYEVDANFMSSPIVTAGASGTRNVEDYSLPYTAVPQELTVYCKFTEWENEIIGTRIWIIGTTTSGILCTRTNGYAFQHFDSASDSTSWVGSIIPGRTVELRCLLASNGSAQIGASFDGGAESMSAVGDALAFGGSWANSLLRIGIDGSSWMAGFANFDSLKVVKGTQTLEFMRGYKE